MKANELRIGNYVYDDVLKDIDTVYQLDLRCVNDCYIKDLNNEMKPIPLTEEWLLKFGFVVFGIDKDHYSLHDFKLFDVGGYYIVTPLPHEYKPIIKHVHQLQNLYFALTGEELTIKENANS